MTLTQSILLGGGLAVGIFGAGVLAGRHSVTPPIAVQVAHAQTEIRQVEQAHIDTVYKRTDHWLTKTLEHFDTVSQHDTILQHLTDTVLVKQFVQACDSLRSSCGAFRDSANALREADHNLIVSQAAELRAWQHSQPSKLKQIATYSAVAIAAFALGKSGVQVPFLH